MNFLKGTIEGELARELVQELVVMQRLIRRSHSTFQEGT